MLRLWRTTTTPSSSVSESISYSSSRTRRWISRTLVQQRSYSNGRILFYPSSDNKNDNNDGSILTPTRLAFGEAAPRIPHMHGLPLVGKPLFPGLVTTITLTDRATIEAMERLNNKSPQAAYISCFLRKKDPTGYSEKSGARLWAPEVITDPGDIYETGTLAQIQRISKSGGGGAVGANVAGSTNSNRTASKSSVGVPNKTDSKNDDDNDDDDDDDDDEQDNNNSDDGEMTATLILTAHRRVDLVSVDNIGPPLDVTVNHWHRRDFASSTGDVSVRALSNEIITTIREVAQMNPLFRESLLLFSKPFDANDPFRLADFAASICASGSPHDLQGVLEEKDPEMRLHKALVLLNREREVSKLQKEISAKVEEQMSEAQRKYFLNEQLKSIKKELGMERDDKDALIEKFRKKLAEYPKVPEEAMETIEAELEKFASLEKNSPEYNVTRSYLDWLVGIPWGVLSDENFDIKRARQILDRDHYGLDDVKDTILEFIAIGKLRGTVQGKILCLAGPPGTGKTSIAKSVADALGRKFYRFSVGGLSDVSEIKGHRRTYIGAMPGKIIQCLKSTGRVNPVVLVDEIDKLGTGFRGDPASALLEVLDPSQNSTFRDHFIDVPIDISKVLFICTANELERIPGPLLDRMEVIRLSGYDFHEKVAIAEQYLIPKSMGESGLMVHKDKDKDKKEDDAESTTTESTATSTESTLSGDDASKVEEEIETGTTPLDNYVHAEGVPTSLSISTGAIQNLVRWYAREAGVRNLAKYIDKITRKLALQVVAEDEGAELTKKSSRKSDSWQITEDNLDEYVGKPVFTSDRLYEDGPLPHGITTGLAYTSMGGSALYIETQGIKRGLDEEGKRRGGGSLKVTGQLGDVMKESTQIAYTVARAWLADIDPTNSFFDTTDIHTHVPEGATPKDGPSAGITIVTSMLSLAMEKPIKNDLAMSGEISLTGKVLPVGGIKEKIMAARRAGISTVILPSANQRDYDEIPDYLKEGLEVHYADHYDKVYEIAFKS